MNHGADATMDAPQAGCHARLCYKHLSNNNSFNNSFAASAKASRGNTSW
jgi:hypothetical protein